MELFLTDLSFKKTFLPLSHIELSEIKVEDEEKSETPKLINFIPYQEVIDQTQNIIEVSETEGFRIGQWIILGLNEVNKETLLITDIIDNTLVLNAVPSYSHIGKIVSDLIVSYTGLKLPEVSTSLTQEVEIGDTEITVTSTTGFAVNDFVHLNGYRATIMDITENTIELDFAIPSYIPLPVKLYKLIPPTSFNYGVPLTFIPNQNFIPFYLQIEIPDTIEIQPNSFNFKLEV